ncbi:MAG: c-type cytochrome, partial [Aquificae bacterium]|nr:c-type cytochrome [Aquificota bacterium]
MLTSATQKVQEATGGVNGQALFNSKGCAACHPATTDGVGPSLQKIAQAYGGDTQKLIQFLKGEGKPIVDPA